MKTTKKYPRPIQRPIQWLPTAARNVGIISDVADNGSRAILSVSGWKSHRYIDAIPFEANRSFKSVIELLNKTAILAYDAALADEDWWMMKNDLAVVELKDIKPEAFESILFPNRDERFY